MSTESVFVYCPRCDRQYEGSTRIKALETMSDHMDKAHPDMENYIKEELEDEKNA